MSPIGGFQASTLLSKSHPNSMPRSASTNWRTRWPAAMRSRSQTTTEVWVKANTNNIHIAYLADTMHIPFTQPLGSRREMHR
jgi:hypothetical protein